MFVYYSTYYYYSFDFITHFLCVIIYDTLSCYQKKKNFLPMVVGQFPSDDGSERLLLTIPDRGFSDLISRCIDCERDNRPTAQELLSELKQL